MTLVALAYPPLPRPPDGGPLGSLNELGFLAFWQLR
jgi:hypothetical protein